LIPARSRPGAMYKNVASIVKPPPPPPTHKVFVYGTLKRGFHNNRLLLEKNAVYVGKAKTLRETRLVVDKRYGIPYLIDSSTDSADTTYAGGGGHGHREVVAGELWEVDGDTLAELDLLEATAEGMYVRKEMEIVFVKEKLDEYTPGKSEILIAWGYVAGPASLAAGIGTTHSNDVTVGEYTQWVHRSTYVPKSKRADGSLGKNLGSAGPSAPPSTIA